MQNQSHDEASPVKVPVTFSPHIIVLLLIQIAIVVGVLVVGAVFLGKFLDAQLNTKPWFTVGLAVLSSILTVFITYRLGMRAISNSEKIDQQLNEQSQKSQMAASNQS